MLEDGGLRTEDVSKITFLYINFSLKTPCARHCEDVGRGNLFVVYVYQQADCRARALLALTDLLCFVLLKVWRDCFNVFVIWLIICKHP
jgi:hypothetical protein